MPPRRTDSALLPDEAVADGPRQRFGGTSGNEILTGAVAAVLVALLIALGLTILDMGGLLRPHMVLGMVLVPPVLLKLSSTGYRFVRYYTGSRPYRAKGPPLLALRVLAPALVVTTLCVFATGVWLLVLGHRAGAVLELHKIAFILWGAVFGVHFLAYAPRVLRSIRADWAPAGRRAVPGAGLRAALVAASVGGGAALALSTLSLITAWHGGHHHHEH